jgi:hypothetical protein
VSFSAGERGILKDGRQLLKRKCVDTLSTRLGPEVPTIRDVDSGVATAMKLRVPRWLC